MSVGGVTVVHIVYSKDKTIRVFHVSESSSLPTAQLTDATTSKQYSADTPFWSVLWKSSQQIVPAGQSTVVGDTRARMIADLTADEVAYSPSFIDMETLNGAPVYHLHLTAEDAADHPLTDLFIDEQSLLVKRAVAAFKDTSVTDVTGSVTLNFDRIAGYWLVTSGEVEATIHAYLTRISGSATFSAAQVVVAAP